MTIREYILIDTDILIDLSRNIKLAVDFVESAAKKSLLTASSVTKMELIVGCRNKVELKNLNTFLLHFQVINLNSQISEIAIELLSKYRLSHGLLIPDALIAATAISENCSFATKNIKDYQFIEGLNLLTYPSSKKGKEQ